MPRPYRSQRQRKPADPILMGEPSPALTKIAKMNTEKLGVHIQTMQTEAERLDTKIGNLASMTPPQEQKVAQLKAHRERLAALLEAAQQQLAGKIERRKNYEAGGSRR